MTTYKTEWNQELIFNSKEEAKNYLWYTEDYERIVKQKQSQGFTSKELFKEVNEMKRFLFENEYDDYIIINK